MHKVHITNMAHCGPKLLNQFKELNNGRDGTIIHILESLEQEPSPYRDHRTLKAFYVLGEFGQVKGWALVFKYKSWAKYSRRRAVQVYVSDAHRRTGIGTTLLKTITEYCRRKRLRPITYPWDYRSESFYKKLAGSKVVESSMEGEWDW